MSNETNVSPPPASDESISSNCSLTDGFAVTVQLFLGVVAISSLLIKRRRERPRRPMLIWFYDTSKQAAAALFIHFFNVIVSYINGESDVKGGNPCVWYFINVLLDTTLGVMVLYVLLDAWTRLIPIFHWEHLRTGNYGQPPQRDIYLKQLGVFLLLTLLDKIVILIALRIPLFLDLGRALLWPLRSWPHVQVLVVMLIFPLTMTIVQFWLVDGLLKAEDDDRHAHLSESGQPLQNASLPIHNAHRRLPSQERGTEAPSSIAASAAAAFIDIQDVEHDELLRELEQDEFIVQDQHFLTSNALAIPVNAATATANAQPPSQLGSPQKSTVVINRRISSL